MEDNEYLKQLSINNKWSPEMSRKYVSTHIGTSKIISEVKETDKNKKKSSSIEEEFIEAASIGDLKSLLHLKSAVQIDVQNSKGQTALIAACLNRQISTIRFLLAKQADISVFDNTGNSALHHACLNDDLVVIKLLLERFDSNFKNKDGQSILHLSVKYEKNEIIEFLIQSSNKININEQDSHGNTAIHIAIEQRNLKLLMKLLTIECDLTLYNNEGLNPINLSIIRDDLECLKILLGSKNGMKVFLNKTLLRETNFQIAVRLKFNGIVDYLLNLKDNVVVNTEIDEKYGYTCLHWATLQINKDLIDKILKKNPNLINIHDSQELTVLEHIVNIYEKSKLNKDTIMEIANILINHDADIYLVRNKNGFKKLLKDMLSRRL